MKQIKPKTLEEFRETIKLGDLLRYNNRRYDRFYLVLTAPEWDEKHNCLTFSVIYQNQFDEADFFDSHLPATTILKRDQK